MSGVLSYCVIPWQHELGRAALPGRKTSVSVRELQPNAEGPTRAIEDAIDNGNGPFLLPFQWCSENDRARAAHVDAPAVSHVDEGFHVQRVQASKRHDERIGIDELAHVAVTRDDQPVNRAPGRS